MSIAMSKSFSLFFLILCSLSFSGMSQAQGGGAQLPQGVELPQGVANLSQGAANLPQGVGNLSQGAGNLPQGGGGDLPCMQNLLPCQTFLKGTSPPPSECCAPMKNLVETQTNCLCDLFGNTVLLQGLNITQDEVLGLAKTCGVKVDSSICQNAAAPGAHTATATPGSGEASKNAASISHVGRYLSVAALFISMAFLKSSGHM